MRKLLTMAFALCACVGFVSCDKTNKDDDGGEGQTVEYKKFVSKITIEFPAEFEDVGSTMSFGYDDKMRVISWTGVAKDGTTKFLEGKYSYATNQVAFNGVETSSRETDESQPEQNHSKATIAVKNTMDAVMTLSEGKVIGGTVGFEQFEDEVSVIKDSEAWELQYNGGYLNKKVATYDDLKTNIDECTWSGDNLVTVKNTGGSRTFTSTAEYDTKLINKEDCNIDINWFVYYDEFFNCVDDSGAAFNFLKFMGKPNKNLVVKTVEGSKNDTYTYEYKLTPDGYVSEVQVFDATKELEITYKIEYLK